MDRRIAFTFIASHSSLHVSQPYSITLFTIVSYILNFLFFVMLLLHKIPFRHAIILLAFVIAYFLVICLFSAQ